MSWRSDWPGALSRRRFDQPGMQDGSSTTLRASKAATSADLAMRARSRAVSRVTSRRASASRSPSGHRHPGSRLARRRRAGMNARPGSDRLQPDQLALDLIEGKRSIGRPTMNEAVRRARIRACEYPDAGTGRGRGRSRTVTARFDLGRSADLVWSALPLFGGASCTSSITARRCGVLADRESAAVSRREADEFAFEEFICAWLVSHGGYRRSRSARRRRTSTAVGDRPRRVVHVHRGDAGASGTPARPGNDADRARVRSHRLAADRPGARSM